MLLAILWALLLISILTAFICGYFYWYHGPTAIWNMAGFYGGTGVAVLLFLIILILKFLYFVA